MSESSMVMDRVFSEVKRLCYAGLDQKPLLRGVAERMRRAVPLELYCMHANDPTSGLITRGVFSGPGSQDVARVALERVQFEDEVTPFGWMVKRRFAALSLSEATGGNPERALRYREVMVPVGFEHEVRGVFALDGELWGSVTAMREPSSPDFDSREVAFSAGSPRTWPQDSRRRRSARRPSANPMVTTLPEFWSSTARGGYSSTPAPPNVGSES